MSLFCQIYFSLNKGEPVSNRILFITQKVNIIYCLYLYHLGIHRLAHGIPQCLLLFLGELFFLFNQQLSIRVFGRRAYEYMNFKVQYLAHFYRKQVYSAMKCHYKINAPDSQSRFIQASLFKIQGLFKDSRLSYCFQGLKIYEKY